MMKLIPLLIFFLTSMSIFPPFSNVTISGTRVIFYEQENEVSVRLNNKGDTPVLVQTWIDNGDANSPPEYSKVPFGLTPPLNRINGNNGQSIKIAVTKKNELPISEESLYWLNVLEIPSAKKNSASGNRLQMAFRTRIKLLYRPKSLSGMRQDDPNDLIWVINNGKLHVNNKGKFHVSLTGIWVDGIQVKLVSDILYPHTIYSYPITNNLIKKHSIIKYKYINDWGAVKTREQSL